MGTFALRILENGTVCRCENCSYKKAWEAAGSPLVLDEKYIANGYVAKTDLEKNIIQFLRHKYCSKSY